MKYFTLNTALNTNRLVNANYGLEDNGTNELLPGYELRFLIQTDNPIIQGEGMQHYIVFGYGNNGHVLTGGDFQRVLNVQPLVNPFITIRPVW